MSGSALVLAAHGSRRDPSANALVRRLAEEVRGRRLFDEVAVAFHQGEPTFDTVLDELRADAVTVVPVMTSAGHYSDVVLPDALRSNRRYGEVRLCQTPAVGTHPSIAPLVARRVTEVLRQEGFERADTAIVVVGHGTPRHPESRTATLALVGTLARRRAAAEVRAAFLDDEPSVADTVLQVDLAQVLVVPFLIGGAHAGEDLPRALGGRRVVVDLPVGSYDGLADIIVDLARRHTPPPPPRPLRKTPRQPRPTPGAVHLVGAGPGDPELITVRGLDLLRRADVVVHDRLIGSVLLHEARFGAELVDVGKSAGHAPYAQEEIDAILIARAREGLTVVRLKGGDPFVFGRGSEELEACRRAGVAVTVVPGISSAIAAPAAVGVPVTARGLARSFAVVPGHEAGEPAVDLVAFAGVDTLVILMGRATLGRLAEALIAAGRDPATPAACIQEATTPNQRVAVATLATIADAADREGLRAPVVTVIGAVAALAHTAAAYVAAIGAPRCAATGS